MATAPVPKTAVNPTKISFKNGKAITTPKHTSIVPGQGVIFYPDSDCIMAFANEKVFGTHCVWLAANKETVLYPVATSEHTKFCVHQCASNEFCASEASPRMLSLKGPQADRLGDPPVGDVG